MKHCSVRAVPNARAVPIKCVGHQHSRNSILRDCGANGEGERAERKEAHHRTNTLEKERYEVACLRQEIIDEYERKSEEILEYLNSFEVAFDRQQLEFQIREAQLVAENKELKNELEGGCRAHLEEQLVQEDEREQRELATQRTMEHLKEENRRAEKTLKKGRRKVQELENELSELQQELKRRDDFLYHKTKIQERTRKKLEIENAALKRKAALGWMIGCLSEIYFRLDPGLGVGSVLKLVRKVQKELEGGNNVFACHMGQAPKVEYDIIQKEIRRLVNRAQVSRTLSKGPACCLLKDTPGRNDIPDVHQSKLCKGGPWHAHSTPETNLETVAGRLECEGVQSVGCCSPRSTSLPHTPSRTACETPCFVVDTSRVNCASSCTSSQVNLLHEHKPLRAVSYTPPSWTPAKEYLQQMNRRQSLRRMLRHLEASMTFLLGQERRRRKAEGRIHVNKAIKRGSICCKH